MISCWEFQVLRLTGNISSIFVSRNSFLRAGEALVSLTDAVPGSEDVSLVDEAAAAQQLLLLEPDPRHPGLVLLHAVAVHNPVILRRQAPLVPPPVVFLPLGGVLLLHLRAAATRPG